MFRGARRGVPGLAGLGAAVVAVGVARRVGRGRELLWSKNLKPGKGVRITMMGPEGPEAIEIEG